MEVLLETEAFTLQSLNGYGKVNLPDGDSVGEKVGAWLGSVEGRPLGSEVGAWVGKEDGKAEGRDVGFILGDVLGDPAWSRVSLVLC